ncbi:putative protein [Geobacter sp. OR-1]|uniref:XdhC family protein n=1 Tax=Geobacter sp. OR-1 TaxID=1266765 RepID=UPI0005441509|nr:XdhC family protein [Geobacter sp. OR-1]GAM09892.1 putative protein [Geobacter sp. OR-1]
MNGGNETVAVFEEVVRLQRAGQPCVLATVIASRGSSPRKAGAKMVVRGDGTSAGTIGGGKVEQEVVRTALKSLADGTGPVSATFVLDETFGHACGGELTVQIEPLGGMPRLVMCGAGHVGQALTHLAALAGFRVSVVDERPDYLAPERLPEAAEYFNGDYAAGVASFQPTEADAVVIATPGYASDLTAVKAALATPAGFIGVIGSMRKKETLFKDLAGLGFTFADLERLTVPVGLAIGGNSPPEIAISIAAQLIERRYRA